MDSHPAWSDPIDDTMFDVEAVENGAWAPGPYGPGDELGTYNEVTPETTARALAMLDTGRPVETYHLSEVLFNGFPAQGSREYRQRLFIVGYRPPPGFDGIVGLVQPEGVANHTSVNEERVVTSWNLGTKINGLHHTGVGDMFYNGFRGSEFARSWGTEKLSNVSTPPIVTRGVLIDVLGVAIEQHRDYFVTKNGNPSLNPLYRITVEDIEAALERQGLGADPFRPGDAILLRTGWSNLIRTDPTLYLEGVPPGPYLRECRYLARNRPALIANDTWCFEIMEPAITEFNTGVPAHQLLFMRYGIRIGEAVRCQELADDGIWEFVFCHTPQRIEGATAGAGPCMALAQKP